MTNRITDGTTCSHTLGFSSSSSSESHSVVVLEERQTSFFIFFLFFYFTIYSRLLILPTPLHLSTRQSSELEHRWGGEEDGAGLHSGLPGLDTISAALEPIHLQRRGFYRVPKLLWLKIYTFYYFIFLPVRLDLQPSALLLQVSVYK